MKYLEMKKRAFMSIVNAVKGFVRTVSGIPPITLPDCVDEESLINYSLSGNSVQNGEPTPENPIEIESVGDLTTKNLLSTMDIWKTKYGYKMPPLNDTPIHMKAGETYTLSFGELTYSQWRIMLFGTYEDGSEWTNSNNPFGTASTPAGSVVTASPIVRWQPGSNVVNKNYFKISCRVNCIVNAVLFWNVANETDKIYGKFMLEYGDTPTEYEPYRKYKIPIKMSGKNWFNINDFQQGANNTENIAVKVKTFENDELCFGSWYANAGGAGITIPLEAGETICINWERVSGDYYGEFLYGADLQSNGVYAKWTYGVNTAKNATSMIVTQKEGYHYINFSIASVGGRYGSKIKNLQIEKSESVTDYEPYIEPIYTTLYLDEPLRKDKDGDYADSIDYKNEKVVRSIYKERITSVDVLSSLVRTYRVFLSIITKKPADAIAGGTYMYGAMSDKFLNIGMYLYGNLGNVGGVIGRHITSKGVNSVAYTFPDSSINTIALAQAAIGDGFDVYYPLAEPEETPITLPKLPTHKGTTIYTIETKVQPSNMSAEYYSTSKGE